MPLSEDRLYARRWWIAATVLIGTWVGTLGNSMLPVALPTMLEHYDMDIRLGVWVISIYVLMVAVLMPVFGWLGDRHGYRHLYLAGLVGLALTCAAAAIAPSLEWMILLRALQGIFNATTLPAVMGVLSQTFPANERGGAMGFWAAVNGGAHSLGPLIGGYLVQQAGWPAIFWLLSTLALAGAVLVALFVPTGRRSESRPFDLLGAAALTAAILILMFNLSQGSNLGWGSSITPIFWLAFIGAAVVFALREASAPHPFVDLRLFSNVRYSSVTAVASVQFFCLMGLPIVLSLYLIGFRGISSSLAGLLIAPLAASMALFSPVAGRVADRAGHQRTMAVGMALVAVGACSMGFWDSSIPLWVVALTLAIIGVGMSLVQSPAAVGVTLAVRDQGLGIAVGIFNMTRFISGTLSASVFGMILGRARSDGGIAHAGFRVSFLLAALLAGGAALLSAWIPRAGSRTGYRRTDQYNGRS